MESKEAYTGVIYLESQDISPKGNIIQQPPIAGKKLILMIYAPWCGYCQKALPGFVSMARELQNSPDMAGLLVDSTVDIQAAQNLKVINTSPGVPAFLLFDKQGNFVKTYNGDRSPQGYMSALQSL